MTTIAGIVALAICIAAMLERPRLSYVYWLMVAALVAYQLCR